MALSFFPVFFPSEGKHYLNPGIRWGFCFLTLFFLTPTLGHMRGKKCCGVWGKERKKDI
jgi:hypothetical protein